MNNNYVVIMAGGVGTRFWPFSRTNNPKQFHDVLGTGSTLLQQTAERFEGICPKENIFIVTNQNYVAIVKEQLPFLKEEQILSEPSRQNTAPCIAYACFKIASKNPNANIVIAPSDHIILKEKEFQKNILIALKETAKNDVLLTLGILPSRPDTGYGYIQFQKDESIIKDVKHFREKPSLELAKLFVTSGEYVWNAGIFIWSANTIIKAFNKYAPDLHKIFNDGNNLYYTSEENKYINTNYPNCENISIDYAILEKANNVKVVIGNIGWSDLGTWKSLYEVSEKDENENVIEGKTMLYDVKNSIIKTPKEKLIVIQGLDGYIIAEHNNVLMICKKEEEQSVKTFVNDAINFGEEFT